jgi:peptidyl-tRNA hydrolase
VSVVVVVVVIAVEWDILTPQQATITLLLKKKRAEMNQESQQQQQEEGNRKEVDNRHTTTEKKPDVIIQYIIVRRDLLEEKHWPLGSLMGQAAHASLAVIAENYNDPFVQQYIAPSNINHMHKIVMQANNEAQLLDLHQKLQQKQIVSRLWVELPENFPTGNNCFHSFVM